MNRRSVLATAGVVLGPLTAGCSRFASDDRQEEYAFGVYNYSDEAHSFGVRVENTSAGVIHEETVHQDAGTASEELPFTGVPVRLYVRIDSSEEHDLPWPASSNADGKISSTAEIRYDQTNQEELLVFG